MKRTKKILLPLAMVVLVTLACSVPGIEVPDVPDIPDIPGDDDDAATATPVDDDNGDEGGGEDVPSDDEEIDIDTLEGLDSYRARMEMYFYPEGDGEPEGMTIEQAQTRDPDASSMKMESEEGGVEYVRIGNQAWSCFDDMCTQTEMSEEEAEAQFGEEMIWEPDDFSPDDLELTGSENVNGVNAKRYELDVDALELGLLSQGQIADAYGQIWIADEADLPAFLVRYEMTWTETRGETAGSVEWLYEVFDVNEPFTIEPPENAAEVPEDIPLYPDAAEMTLMDTFIMFSAADDVETVAEFYRSELPGMGWENESDDMMSGTSMQSWAKEGRTIQVMIAPIEGEDGCEVTIMIEE